MAKNKIEPEIDFKELIKKPERLFGFNYLILPVIILVAGIFYVKSLDEISLNSYPAVNFDSLNVEHDIEKRAGSVEPSIDLKLISASSAENIEKGKALYTVTCSACHGENGLGDGPGGVALDPKPRNFHTTEGWINGRNFSDIYKTIQSGIPGTGMVAYEFLPTEDKFYIIHFIRSLADFPDFTDDELAVLDKTYKLSEGVFVPNQIPISLAMQKISDESAIDEEIKMVCNYVLANSSDPGARIFFDVSQNYKQVFSSIMRSDVYLDQTKFIASVTAEPAALGFRAEILRLSDVEWKSLFRFISRSVMNVKS